MVDKLISLLKGIEDNTRKILNVSRARVNAKANAVSAILYGSTHNPMIAVDSSATHNSNCRQYENMFATIRLSLLAISCTN